MGLALDGMIRISVNLSPTTSSATLIRPQELAVNLTLQRLPHERNTASVPVVFWNLEGCGMTEEQFKMLLKGLTDAQVMWMAKAIEERALAPQSPVLASFSVQPRPQRDKPQ